MSGSLGGIQNGKDVEYLEFEGKKFVKVYNDLGSAVIEGAVYCIEFLTDADGNSFIPTLAVPATTTVPRHLVVIQNYIKGKSGIADAAWGWAQMQGWCELVNSGATITAENYMEVLTTATAAINAGARTVEAFGVAKATTSGAGTFAAYLFGIPVQIAAT